MSFDISKIDTQDVVNAIKMLRISTNVVNKHQNVLIRNKVKKRCQTMAFAILFQYRLQLSCMTNQS